MPSSTSSSDARVGRGRLDGPVYERPLPGRPLMQVVVLAGVVFAIALGAWEAYWRAWGAEPAFRNSPGLWSIQRRRIDAGEGDALVITGSSRMLFNTQLHVWERLAGQRPIQLAIEGTSPLPVLEQLADDPDFTGDLVVGVSPDLFFTGYTYVKSKYELYPKETPSQRAGQWLSMRLVEPWAAFYDEDFALTTVLKRQPWPDRPGVTVPVDVRRLAVSARDRNTHMWDKLESDPDYAALAQRIWAQDFGEIPFGSMQALRKKWLEQIERAVKVTGRLRARGVRVVFVRPPVDADYRRFEDQYFPRRETWDVLLARTGVPGIHFEDHPAMQGLRLPEWSHLARVDAEKFTAALQPLVSQALASQGTRPGEGG